MYYRIEREYLNETKRNIKYIWTLTALVSFIVLQFLSNGAYTSSFINYVIIIFSILLLQLLLYYIYDMKNILKQQDIEKINFNLKKLICTYINQKNKNKIKILINILKNEKITKKEDIKDLIDYYNKKKPLNIKPSLISTLIEASSLLIALIGLGFDGNNMTFNLQEVALTIAVTIAITFIIYSIRSMIKLLTCIINIPDTDLYIELEDLLREIYYKYDKHFKKNNLIKIIISQLFK